MLQSFEPSPILLAEDDHDDAFFMQRAFARSALPNRLVHVEDGLAVVNYLSGTGPYADRKEHPLPGLLLLDLKMPRMNGFDVLEWLQGRPEFNRLPVVILSGSGISEDVRRAEQLGADDYRVKSSNVHHLKQMIAELRARWLNGHRKGDPEPTRPAAVKGPLPAVVNDLLAFGANPDCRLLICRPVGPLTTEHIAQLLDFLLHFQDSEPKPFNRLLDLTLVTEIKFGSIVVHEYARARRAAIATLRPSRTAIIAPEPDKEHVADIYALLMRDTNIQVRVFRDGSSAADWLCVSKNHLSPETAPAVCAPGPTAPSISAA